MIRALAIAAAMAGCGRVDFGARVDGSIGMRDGVIGDAGSDATVPGVIALEPGFPVFVDVDSNPGTTVTTPAFSTLGPDRLLVVVFVWGTGGTDESPLAISGGGVTWTQQVYSSFAPGPVPANTSGDAIWTAWAATPITAQTVTASRGSTVEQAGMTVGVYAFTGASATPGATAQQETQTMDTQLATTITTTTPGSYVIAGFHAGTADTAPAPLPSTVFDETDDYMLQPEHHFQAIGHAAALTTTPGPLVLGSLYNGPYVITSSLEILPAP